LAVETPAQCGKRAESQVAKPRIQNLSLLQGRTFF
jgi:hypothetical protein